MKTPLTIEERQAILLQVLKENIGTKIATFGVGKDVVSPLVKKGLIHKDTYKFTGGCILTKKGINHLK